MSIKSDFNQLTNISTALQQNKENSLKSSELESLVNQLGNTLTDLSKHSKEDLDFGDSKIRKDIARVLKAIAKKLETFGKQDEKIKNLRDRVLGAQKDIETMPFSKETIPKVKIDLKIGLYCDFDSVDNNGAITICLLPAILQNIPFITTRTLLHATNVFDEQNKAELFFKIKISLMQTELDWEIFQQYNPDTEEELLVFLPKSLMSEKSGLEALDFVNDGSLHQIYLKELYEGEVKRKGSTSAFFKLFNNDPKVNKIFYLVGHGSIDTVGALNAEHYNQLLDFLENQNCKGLTLTSCCSGGKVSLLNISKQPETEKNVRFKDQAKPHTFVTIVRSVGDFPTYWGEVESSPKEYFDELESFLSNSPQTISNFRKTIEKVEKGKRKPIENLVQIYFPHSAGSPSGFRLTEEGNVGYSLTFNRLRKSEVESRKGLSSDIVVKNKDVLHLYPLVCLQPISFVNKDSLLLSEIPGRAHHMIKTIKLAGLTPEALIERTIDFHKKGRIKTNKGFFIGSLESKEKAYKEIILLITTRGFQYVYREGDQYYLKNNTTFKPISAFQHARFFKEALGMTLPTSLAVRASSGGQESEGDFKEAVLGRNFWTSEYNHLRAGSLFLDRLIKLKMIKKFVNTLEAEDKVSLVFDLLMHGQEDLAVGIFKKEKMDPNVKDVNGMPILLRAELSNCDDMIFYLIDKDVRSEGEWTPPY